jgi:hypothetical protein
MLKTDLRAQIIALADQFAVAGFLDVSAGGSALGAALQALDRNVRTFDLLGLLSSSNDQFSLMLGDMIPGLQKDWGDHWMAVCIQTLERLDQRAIGPVLHALNCLSGRFLYVEINHSPSESYNRFHQSVLPLETWLSFFRKAGFEHVRDAAFAGEGEVPPSDPLRTHWKMLNPFRMEKPFAASRLLLEKVRSVAIQDAFLADWRKSFPWLSELPWAPKGAIPDPGPIALPVLHMQDFTALYPLAAGLPRQRSHFILRFGGHEPNPLNVRSIESFLLARNHQVIADLSTTESVRALPEEAVVISASESTGSTLHIVSSGLSAAARGHGLGTAQLQHGIMIPDGQWEPYHIASQHLFAWSSAHSDALRSCGCLEPPAMSIVGCPKFDLSEKAVPWEIVLGPWVNAWPRKCIIAANTSWHAHGTRTAELDEALLQIACRHPDWLFLIKTHPSYPEQVLPREALPENVAFLTDPALLVLDRPFQALLPEADALIATQSTSLLDAAAASVPFVVVDTAHPSPYRFLTTLPAKEVVLPDAAVLNNDFRNYYLAEHTLGQASALLLSEIPALRAAAAPSPGFSGWAEVARRYGDLLRTGQVSRPKPNAPPPRSLPFPFDLANSPEPLWLPEASVRITNGNKWCRVTGSGIILHPNQSRDKPVILRYDGLDLSGAQLLVARVQTGARCPRVELVIDAFAGETKVGSWPHRLVASDNLRLRISFEGYAATTLAITVALDPEEKSSQHSSIYMNNLEIITRR